MKPVKYKKWKVYEATSKFKADEDRKSFNFP